jgi:glycerophosphoryl diester phosphodiesterase
MDIPELQQLYMKHKDSLLGKTFDMGVGAVDPKEDTKEMTNGIDLQSLSTGGGLGGAGGGLLGGVLLGALLGRNGGIFGGNGNEASEVNNIESVVNTNAILTGIADIKAAVPYNEAQVQLALGNAVATLTSAQTADTQYLSQGQTAIQLAQQAIAANLSRDLGLVSTQVATGFGELNSNVERTGWALSREISNDGEKTRSLISSIDRENLNRIITTQASELVELRNESSRERDRHGIEITMTNMQNQNQLQTQSQNQALNTIAAVLADVSQVARATNSNVIVGNTGRVDTSSTANPTNVRA